MLKGIDPLLSGRLLHELDRLGHGQQLAVVDGNYPAYRSGAPVVAMGSGLVDTLRAILSVFPLDPDVPVARMQVEDDPETTHPQMRAALDLPREATGVEAVARADFYARVDASALVVLTRETEPFANLILTKGVVVVDG